MNRRNGHFVLLVCLVVLAGLADAQPVLRLKGWQIEDAGRSEAPAVLRTRTPSRAHYLVQFAEEPGTSQTNALSDRGATVLSYVPESAFSVAMNERTDLSGLGIRWIGRLRPQQKLSPNLKAAPGGGNSQMLVVEFYADVGDGEARAIAVESGATIHDNPDLLPHHLLLEGTAAQVQKLSEWDEVSYIFPASEDLARGIPVHGCAGALTSSGPVGQAVPLVGDGWDGPGLGSAELNYTFISLTDQAPQDSVESEIERAFAEWASYVQITFAPTNNPMAPRTLAVLFASGAHGDGYPFNGPGGVIAHTFYPSPLSPEPIAGDEHFNVDQSWRIGRNLDVFSVALHETGHALGLGHSDDPGDVMYPYYRMVSGLGAGDIAAIRQLYAAAQILDGPTLPVTGGNTPDVEPLAITIQQPATTTSASTITLSGTVSGGSGAVLVGWSTNRGVSGGTQFVAAQNSGNWASTAIPLSAGANTITVTALDAKQNQASQSVTVTYQSASTPGSDPGAGSGGSAGPGTGAGGSNPGAGAGSGVGNPGGSANPGAGPGNPGAADTVPPSITILSPAMTTVATSASSIVISGTAQDNVGVTEVTWSSSTGASGVAAGTSDWSTGPVPLYVGTTTIMIFATDAAKNQAWRSITVTRN